MRHLATLPLGRPARQRKMLARPYAESDSVYDAVLSLRRAGFRVYRAGQSMHVVDGKRTPTPTLLAMAAVARPRAEQTEK